MAWFSFLAGDGFTGNIKEKSAGYQVRLNDGYVAMTGTVNATLPKLAEARNGVWLDCVSGAISVLGDAPIQAPLVLTTGVKGFFVPLKESWRQS